MLYPYIIPIASCPGPLINPKGLKLPTLRANFHGPNDV